MFGYTLGALLGWVELMVVAAGCLLALIIAVPFVVGRIQMDVTRSLARDRVMVGDPATALLTIQNTRRVPSMSRSVEEYVAGAPLVIDVPSLASGRAMEAPYQLPTNRRGVVAVGPAVISRGDPLGMMRREIEQLEADELWVHPKYAAVRPLPVGFAKDLEGPTTDTSPAGDVSFHALREYQLGDDFRHIHWTSTARTGWLTDPSQGSLLVRHYVDNRRPQLAILLDTMSSAYADPAEDFELAVSVVASMALSAMVDRQPVSVRSGDDVLLGQTRRASRPDLLDRLTVVETAADGDLAGSVIEALQGELGTSALALVTGSNRSEELTRVVTLARRSVRVIVVRVTPPGRRREPPVPRALAVDASSLPEFKLAWDRIAA